MKINFFSKSIVRTPKNGLEFLKQILKLNMEELIEFSLKKEEILADIYIASEDFYNLLIKSKEIKDSQNR